MGVEKRGHPRYRLTREVRARELSLLGSPKIRTGWLRGRIQNISRGGLCLLTHQGMKVSRLCLCEIRFPKIPVSIPTLLQVRWTQKSAKGASYRAGLQFLL